MKFLTSAQKEFYKDNGFVLLSNVFTHSQCEEMSKDYNNIFKRKAEEKAHMNALWQGDWQEKVIDKKDTESKNLHVQSIHNLQYHSATFTRAIMNPNLLDALEDVMETENIVLHHTKAHLKPPEEGAPFPMHQDYHYFPYEHDSMVAVFVHLDETSPENGGLAVFPGSHKLGPLEDKSTQSGWHYVDQDKFKLSEATSIHAKRGDVVIFSYLLVHGSYLNTSERVRRMFLIQLNSADDDPLTMMHKSPGSGMLLRGENVRMKAERPKLTDK